MAVFDIRQDPLIFALHQLDQEREANKKNKILNEIARLIKRNEIAVILSILAKYLSAEHLELNQQKLEKQLIAIKNNSAALTMESCEAFIRLLKAPQNNAFEKNSTYTDYLIACEAYKKQTGVEAPRDQVESCTTKNAAHVTPVTEPQVPQPAVPHTTKTPLFFNTTEYQDNTTVRKVRGIPLAEYLKISESVADVLNRKSPGSVRIEKRGTGYSIEIHDEKISLEFKRLEEQALAEKYQIFEFTADKKTKNMPEKYAQHFSSHQEEERPRHGMRR